MVTCSTEQVRIGLEAALNRAISAKLAAVNASLVENDRKNDPRKISEVPPSNQFI